jgi:hypothetical protein
MCRVQRRLFHVVDIFYIYIQGVSNKRGENKNKKIKKHTGKGNGTLLNEESWRLCVIEA